MIGQIISHYKIIKKIGSGGMGEVYQAEDLKLGRQVALKFLPRSISGSGEDKIRFEREARASAKINHPNICAIHEIDEFDGQTFIVMELIEGENLLSRLNAKDLDPAKITDIAIQIVEGIKEAHSKGIIHRDIKSANVMIKPDGRAVLMDFGLASSDEFTRITSTGTSMGTVAYMSPEQARGEEVDYQTDIWSFGVVIYEMVTGKLPFHGKNYQSTIYKILNEDPEPLKIRDDIWGMNITAIIGKTLVKKKSERYKKIDDLLRDLLSLRSYSIGHYSSTITATGGITKVLGPRKSNRKKVAFIAAPLTIFIFVAGYFLIKNLGSLSNSHKSQFWNEKIVVLPFKNLGNEEDNFFADGITDEITIKLAKVEGLGVISRTSADIYKDVKIDIKKIADELDVSYVLEGKIHWQKSDNKQSRVKVTPELIRTSDNTQVWAEVYEADLQDIFKIQSEIAIAVAKELNIKIFDKRDKIGLSIPTSNMEAYGYYLRGLSYLNKGYEVKYWEMAEKMFDMAVKIDPSFSLAYANLSTVYSNLYSFQMVQDIKILDKSKKSFEKALELDPDLPEAYIAKSDYYAGGFKDFKNALKYLDIAQIGMKDNSEVIFKKGVRLRRSGNMEDAYKYLIKSCELNPRSAWYYQNLGSLAMQMRKYPEAEKYLTRALLLDPGFSTTYHDFLRLYLAWDGNTKRARQFIQKNSALIMSFEDRTALAAVEWTDGNTKEALSYLDQGYLNTKDLPTLLELDIWKIAVYLMIGNKEDANKIAKDSLPAVQSLLKQFPTNHYLHVFMGYFNAGLSRINEAILCLEKAQELMPMEKDTFEGALIIEYCLPLYMIVGKYDRAIDLLDKILPVAPDMSIKLVKNSYIYSRLHTLPRFIMLVKKYEK